MSMKLFLSVISLCLLIGSGSALKCVYQRGIQPIGVPNSILRCPSFAKSCYTVTTLDSEERGCSADNIQEDICEITYHSGLNLGPVRIPQVHPLSESCWCNTDLCNLGEQ